MRKVLKITTFIIAIIILMLVSIAIFIETPAGQRFVRGRAEAFLKGKLKTEVHIGYLGYGIPKFIVIKDVLLLDQAHDTLLAAGELKIDISMLQLLYKQVSVQQIVLNDAYGHIYRSAPDTNFNFTYIIDAFAGKKTSAAKIKDSTKKTSTAFSIDVDHIALKNIRFRVDDQMGGLYMAMKLGNLDLRMKSLDLDSMAFKIKSLSVSDLSSTYTQDSSLLPSKITSNKKAQLTLVADNVQLKNVDFNYADKVNNLLFGIQAGDILLKLNKFDLGNYIVDVKTLAVNNTNGVLLFGKSTKAAGKQDSTTKIDSSEGWHVTAKAVDLGNIAFRMDNENKPRVPSGIDYQHLDLTNVSVGVRNLSYSIDSITGSVTHIAASEKCGLQVQELKTTFRYSDTGVVLNELFLQTPHSLVRKSIAISYPSIQALQQNPGKLNLTTDVINSIVGFEDILYFVPDLVKQDIFRRFPRTQVRIDAKLNGALDNMYIGHLYLLAMNGTELDLKGRVSGLPDAKKINYNLSIAKLNSSRTAVSDFVPDSLLAAIRLPDRFSLSGNVAGSLLDYRMDINLASTDGSAFVKGSLAMSPGKGREKYDMLVQVHRLNLGKILKQDSLIGFVSAAVTAKGTGFDPKTMTATVNGAIGDAYLRKYSYHDILIKADIHVARGTLSLSSADSNLRLRLNATADFTGKYVGATADIMLDSIDFRALKCSTTDLRARGLIHADFPVLNPDYPEGTLSWLQPMVVVGGKQYLIDSINIKSIPQNGSQDIFANLDVLTAHITGKMPLTKIGNVLMDRINIQTVLKITDSGIAKTSLRQKTSSPKIADTTLPSDYDLQVVAKMIDKPLLHSLLPGLTSFDSISVAGNITPRQFALKVMAPEIVYGSNTLINGSVNISCTDSAFSYQINADKIASGTLNLWNANLNGHLDKGLLTIDVSTADSNKKERFALTGNVLLAGDSQIIHLDSGLMLNYEKWEVAQPNSITLTNGGYYINNLNISKSGQFIRANSERQAVLSPLKIDISKFRLSNLTSIISSGDTLLATGIVDAAFTILPTNNAQQVSGNFNVKQLSVMADTVGDLKGSISIADASTLHTKLNINGQGNDIDLEGDYFLASKTANDFNMSLHIKALALRSFEGFSMKQIRESSGYIRGNLQLTGKVTAPIIIGELKTDNLKTNIAQINSMFKFPAEKITFTENLVSFSNFTILDSPDNKAILNGSIGTKDLLNPTFNLDVAANHWRAVHSTQKDNGIFYGDLYVTTKVKLEGSMNAPRADGTINVLKGTNLTVVTPEGKPELESSKGIVRFVNMRDTGKKKLALRKPASHAVAKSVSADVNVNIEVDKAAKFGLIIDQASGDFISVQGTGFLNTSLSPTGGILLTGNYELSQGTYQFNYNFVKRKFQIQPGSTITFTGDPVTGTNMDIVAKYETMAPPYDLVQREVADQGQLNYYKQRLPFDVDLYMKGKVLKPALSFDITLPENKVYPLTTDQIELIRGKLSQVRTDTSELNKQVFAMLILNRFVSDDPFRSDASSSATFTALQSVSTFIGEQLNQAAGKFVKGVDFSVDLATTEDYTSGDMRQRTDLNLAASKQLLNDRLKLTIGNNFELDAPQNTNQQTSYVPTNLAADYLLSADGKYTMRAYRRAYDEGVLQGYITETGLNFIVSLDYNNFNDVLKPRRNARKQTQDTSKTKLPTAQ